MSPLRFAIPALAVLLLAGCAKPLPNMAFVSPDGFRWVAIESVPPAPDADEQVPTVRLVLRSRWWPRGLTLLDGVPTLCGTTVQWQDDATLFLRLPADRAFALKVRDQDAWSGVSVRVALHEDQVRLQSWSPDHERRLVVIQACESEAWNLYLRRKDEPNYNAAMRTGWDDPDLYGGFEANQPPLSLTWTGPRSAVIVVPGKRYGVTLREKVGDVAVRWVINERAKAPHEEFRTLKPLGK